MIKEFGNKETEKIWNGIRSKKLPSEIQNVARRKLRMLNNAFDISDLRIPPANRLEKLKGNLSEYHSIRINNQWRIVFKWLNDDAYEVKISHVRHSYGTRCELDIFKPGQHVGRDRSVESARTFQVGLELIRRAVLARPIWVSDGIGQAMRLPFA